MDGRDLVLFGARGGTGLHLARLARAGGWAVTAVIRPGADAGGLPDLGCRVVEADALDRARVADVMGATRPGRVVASTLGSRTGGPLVDDAGNIAVIDAAAGCGATARMLLVTSLGCGDSRGFASERLLAAIGDVLHAKTRAEDHLRASGLPFVIVRPGGLVSDPPTGRGALYEDARVHGRIGRADLAALLLPCLTAGQAVGRTFSAVDRDRRTGPDDVVALARFGP